MPTAYHTECTKPVAVKRTNLHLPRRVKSFHSKSAPNSPLQLRNTPANEPRYTKAVHLLFEAKRIAKELEEKKLNGELIKYRPRGLSIKSKENDQWQNTSRNCESCSNTLKAGMFSTHRNLAYCNVPCYSMLFSPLATRSNTLPLQDSKSKTTDLSPEQETKRNTLIPKLRTYNTYYSEKPCQICCLEENKEFMLEGQLKVYWGVKSPVTLTDSDVSYWRNFKPEPPSSRLNNQQIKLDENCNKVQPMVRSVRRAKSQYARKQQRPESAIVMSKNDSIPAKVKRTQSTALKRKGKHLDNMQFTPPHGSATTIRITDKVKVNDVISMLLRKFQIRNKAEQYALFIVFESGSIRQLQPEDSPLLTRLRLGPCEDVAKMFVMEKEGQTEVSHEVAQYAQFSMTVLEKFHEKFIEEEEREINRIKAKYESFKSMLRLQLEEIHNNLKETEV